jgi:hypothetical protein
MVWIERPSIQLSWCVMLNLDLLIKETAIAYSKHIPKDAIIAFLYKRGVPNDTIYLLVIAGEILFNSWGEEEVTRPEIYIGDLKDGLSK